MTTLPDWLPQRARLTPDALAITCDGINWTWGDLFQQAVAQAHELRAQGIGIGQRVTLLGQNGLPYVVAVHALILLRAVVIPLNIRLTPAELRWQVADAGAAFLLYDKSHGAVVAEIAGTLPTLVIDYPPIEKVQSWEATPLNLDDPHCIIYTSGTTGQPKGVVLTYDNHWYSAIGSALNLGLHTNDHWLLVLPLFHVGGLSILFRSVIYGIPVCLHKRFDVEAVNATLDQGDVTIVSLVATMLQRLLDARSTRLPPSLRAVLLGGGPCPEPLLMQAGSLPLIQTYGMTETASQVVTLAPRDAFRKQGAAGKPLFPNEIRIEEKGEQVAAGVVGEIVVRGPSVTPGYADRPEATAQAIRDGWLYTGDMGYFDPEGYLYVVDRRSDLIITGGENVYPAEVEAALLSYSAVAEAGVVGLPDSAWGQRVVAALVLKEGATLDEAELRAHLAQRLAKYKLPREFRRLPALPRNATGKLQRAKLREQLLHNQGGGLTDKA